MLERDHQGMQNARDDAIFLSNKNTKRGCNMSSRMSLKLGQFLQINNIQAVVRHQ